MRQIKAKPGVFKGTEYRSRLEIIWAAFFDHMGIEFEYEPRRYDLPSGSYLPDFFLKNVRYVETKYDTDQTCTEGLWVEIKNPLECTTTRRGIPGSDYRNMREANIEALPHRLMEELVYECGEFSTLDGCRHGPAGTVIWFHPYDQYVAVNGNRGIEIENGVIDMCETCVYRDSDSATYKENNAFWKCPMCGTISYARALVARNYKIGHTDDCPRSHQEGWSLEDIMDWGSVDILVLDRDIWYGSIHEKIGQVT